MVIIASSRLDITNRDARRGDLQSEQREDAFAAGAHGSFWHKADMPLALMNVRFWG
jgi:hypothetical protein